MKEKAETAWNRLKCVLSFWLSIGILSGLFNCIFFPVLMVASDFNPQYSSLKILFFFLAGGTLMGLTIGLVFWLYLHGTKSKIPEVMREMTFDLKLFGFSQKKEEKE